MSDAAYNIEDLTAEVMALRNQMVPILSASTQGAAVGACLQVIYEQLHDPAIPATNLQFVQQQLEVLQTIITARLGELTAPASTVRH